MTVPDSITTNVETQVFVGNALEVLPLLSTGSVNCVVTSPPYWGQRKYFDGQQIWGGERDCAHEWGEEIRTPWANEVAGPNGRRKNVVATRERPKYTGPFCKCCGAWKGELGQEPHPDLFVEHIVDIFRGVRRVLRDDGVVQINMGDSYGSVDKMSSKNLLGIPWRVALGLQRDGWILRCDSIWNKEKTLPEAVKDRPTRCHEYVFLLSKKECYFYDWEAVAQDTLAAQRPQRKRALEIAKEAGLTSEHFAAIRSAGITDTGKATHTQTGTGKNTARVQELAGHAKDVLKGYYREFLTGEKKNLRSVFSIATKPFKGKHYASFPLELPDLLIRAACPPGGTVLDPFWGVGTTGIAAEKLGCHSIGIELNPEYARMSKERILQIHPHSSCRLIESGHEMMNYIQTHASQLPCN